MNPQIQFLQLVPVWCFIPSDHWISRKLSFIVLLLTLVSFQVVNTVFGSSKW